MSFGETKANIVWGHTCLFKRAFSLRSVMGCFTLPSVLNSLPDDGEISVGRGKKLLGHLMTFLEYWRQNVMFTLLVVPSENSSSVFVRFNTSWPCLHCLFTQTPKVHNQKGSCCVLAGVSGLCQSICTTRETRFSTWHFVTTVVKESVDKSACLDILTGKAQKVSTFCSDDHLWFCTNWRLAQCSAGVLMSFY